MSLGVLNNLSAVYAENNLNNSNNSLNTVLQQLSSGSKINSGADDAAGLSLVNGLQANQMALTQSKTNATEGVGLLQVADGALSQVTSLLNRAVTLATEASNGTLNSSQDTAANQEYQSILSEITNIGSTTTYNGQAVFNSKTNIYTGDSSTSGSSINELNIRTLSSSNIGDSGGVMAYSNGQDNVFLNLSTDTANAAATDTLNTSGTTTLNVSFLVPGASGNNVTATTAITVGGTSGYANTAGGMISAINNSGLGLTASFTTQAQAGVQGGGIETGIQITGGLISAGVDPNASSTSGMLNPAGISAGELLTQGQTVTVKQGGTTAVAVTISSSINTLAELASAINTGSSNAVTATVVTNGDGTQSLSLANALSTQGALTVTAASGSNTAPAFAAAVAGTNSTNVQTTATVATGVAATIAVNSNVTFGAAGTNATGDLLTAGTSIVLQNTIPNATTAMTFVVGAGTDTATKFFTANNTTGITTNTLGGLAEAINENTTTDRFNSGAGLGAAATIGASGITVTDSSALTGENITVTANTLTNANAGLSLYTPTEGGAAVTGTPTVTALDAGAGTAQDDVLSTGTHITLTNALGTTTFTAAAGQTYADLALQITGSSLGVTASFVPNAGNGALLLTSNTTGVNPITVTANNLTDSTVAGGPTAVAKDVAFTGVQPGTAGTPGTHATAILQLSTGVLNDGTASLTGQIQIQNGAGTAQTFVMGAGSDAGTTYYTGANTVASLVTKINGVAALGITASAPGGGSGGIYLQSNAVGTGNITTPGVTTLASAVAVTAGSTIVGVTAVTGNAAVTTVGPASGAVNTGDTLAANSSISITNGGVTDVFVVGAGTDSVAGASRTYYTANAGDGTGTLQNLAATIQADHTRLGLATTGGAVASTGGLTLTSVIEAGTITTGANTLADTTQGTFSTDVISGFASSSDTVSGTLSFSVGGSAKSLTLTTGETVAQMVDQINGAGKGVTASLVAGSNGWESVKLTANTEGTAGNITATSGTSVTDTTTTAALSYTATSAYSTGLSSSGSNKVFDSTAGQSTGAAATFAANEKAGSGIATISYSDGAGVSLSATDLTNQTNAQEALTSLNQAITAVAAQDGYIGAQINTLNAVSQVLSTQQENVQAAQNAVQATDYASATSNMSKYEILSQTGIAALAQANTVQQEVLKLLQ